MAITPFEHAFPVEFGAGENEARQSAQPDEFEAKVASYVQTWRNQCRSVFIQRRNIWDDCWKLYRGLDDWSRKEDWQSKIVLQELGLR